MQKTNHKKIFITLLLVFSISLSLFFLVKSKNEENQFTFWTIQLKPVATEFIQKNINKFQSRHPKLKVVWVDIPIAEAQKRTLASILGGNPPDLINLNPDFSVLLAQKDTLETFEEKDLKSFQSALLNVLKYEDKIFAVPFYATSSLTVYNKKCTGNAPSLKTYGDILNIKKGSCKYAFAINLNENDTFSRILNKYAITDFGNNESTEKARKVFDLFKKMYDEKIITKDSLTINHREVAEKFMAKNVAVVVIGGNFVKMIKENAPDVYENSDVTAQLTGDSGKYDISLMNFVIPKRAKNKELAKEFLSLLTNVENQIEFAKLTNVLPANKKALEDDFFKCDKNSDLIDKARCVSALQLQNLSVKNFGYQNKKMINDTINRALETYLLQNNSDSVKNMENEINKFAN